MLLCGLCDLAVALCGLSVPFGSTTEGPHYFVVQLPAATTTTSEAAAPEAAAAESAARMVAAGAAKASAGSAAASDRAQILRAPRAVHTGRIVAIELIAGGR